MGSYAIFSWVNIKDYYVENEKYNDLVIIYRKLLLLLIIIIKYKFHRQFFIIK